MADDVTSNEQLPRPESEEAEEAMITEPPQNEANTARLMITKIVNENFKSYAGVQELGPFHKVNPWLSFSDKFLLFSTFILFKTV